MKTKTPQNNLRIMKNITRQCRNENKNTKKQGKNNEKTAQDNAEMKTKTQQNKERIKNMVFFLYTYIVLWCFSLYLHCFVVFFFILTLFCCFFLYTYIVLWNKVGIKKKHHKTM
jgi:cation transport ATPase